MQNAKHVILYVDDDQDFLDAMRMFFEANGYAMVEAASAEEGLKAYKKTKPDLIIADLMMEEIPGMKPICQKVQVAGLH